MAVSAEDRSRIMDLYKKNVSIHNIELQMHYSHVTIKKILVEEGLYDPSRRKIPKPPEKAVLSRPCEWYQKQKEDTSIKMKDIMQIRAETKIGDVFYIRTDKSDRYADDEMDKVLSQPGALRKVTVISKSSPRFCIVRLDSGVTEAVLWADIIKNKRKAKG